MNSVKGLWKILKKSAKSLSADKIPKQSASLAYCTLFSMGAMLLVIIFLTNLVWRDAAAEGIVVQQLTNLIGRESAQQIQQIIQMLLLIAALHLPLLLVLLRCCWVQALYLPRYRTP